MKWFSPTYLLTHLLMAQSAVSRNLPPTPQRLYTTLALPPATSASFTEAAFFPVPLARRARLAIDFAQPASAAVVERTGNQPLTAEEKKYFCLSVQEGAGKYMDLMSEESFDFRSKSGVFAHPRADAFAGRFKIIYTEGQKALYFAAGKIDADFAAEDDAIRDTDFFRLSGGLSGPSAWWNDWNRSSQKNEVDRNIHAFERRLRYADHFFHRLQQVRNYLYETFSVNITLTERVQVRCRIDLELCNIARQAKDAMTDEGIPPAAYPTVEAVSPAVQRFLRVLRREPETRATTTTTTRTATTIAPGISRLNRAIGDINRFYSGNTTQVMGTAFSRKLPNMPELELLASGVVTYCGRDALNNALKYAPRGHQHSNPKISTRWKYAAQIFVDADRHHAIPIKALRYEDPNMLITMPYAKYHDLEIRGDSYRVDKGTWRRNPYPEEDVLEQAKYLRLSFLIKQARQRREKILKHDEPRSDHDFTGSGWLKPIAMALGMGQRQNWA